MSSRKCLIPCPVLLIGRLPRVATPGNITLGLINPRSELMVCRDVRVDSAFPCLWDRGVLLAQELCCLSLAVRWLCRAAVPAAAGACPGHWEHSLSVLQCWGGGSGHCPAQSCCCCCWDCPGTSGNEELPDWFGASLSLPSLAALPVTWCVFWHDKIITKEGLLLCDETWLMFLRLYWVNWIGISRA